MGGEYSPPTKKSVMKKLSPLPYQEKALQELSRKRGRAILAFKPGTGKSFTSLWFAKEHNFQNICILCPKSKIPEWVADVKEIFPHLPINFPNIVFMYQLPGVFISTYQSVDYLDGIPFDYVIMDESTIIKEADTKVFKKVLNFLNESKPKAVVCLTGTPALNHPYELWAQLKAINYDNNFISWETFVKKFCIYQYDKRYNQIRFKGVKHPELLRKFVNQYIITISKEDSQEIKLPPLHVKKIWISNYTYIDNGKEIGIKKIDTAVELINRYFAKHQEPVVVFTWHVDVSQELIRKLHGKYQTAFIYGKQTIREREKIINNFNARKINVLVCNIKAAGMGLNLQKAWFGILLETYWPPKLIEQAIKRLHRKGQTKPVYIAILLLENSRDQKVLANWRKKNKNINLVLNL